MVPSRIGARGDQRLDDGVASVLGDVLRDLRPAGSAANRQAGCRPEKYFSKCAFNLIPDGRLTPEARWPPQPTGPAGQTLRNPPIPWRTSAQGPEWRADRANDAMISKFNGTHEIQKSLVRQKSGQYFLFPYYLVCSEPWPSPPAPDFF